MSNDFNLAQSIAQDAQRCEQALMDETCHSLFLLQPDVSAKVLLLFHGFTATPAQFKPLGQALFEAGYSVVIPLLPGHGLAGDWNKHTPPPLPEDPQTYQQFGYEWLKRVQDLGQEVLVGGLSGGATLAAWLGLEHPQLVDRTLLFAPYLRNSSVILDLLIQHLDVYFEWKVDEGQAQYGYKGFAMPALRTFLDMGQELLESAKTQFNVPTLFVLSESDRSISPHDLETLFAAVVERQPKSWYCCFDQVFDIPHTMLTREEGNHCIDLLISIAKAYVESNLTWTEVLQIRDRITQGASFDQAVASLDLGDRVSADLVTLVTMHAA